MKSLVCEVQNEVPTEDEQTSTQKTVQRSRKISKSIKVLAIIQLLLGFTCFSIEIAANLGVRGKFSPVAGAWSGIIFIINGIIGGSGIKPKRTLRRKALVALVTGVIAAVASLALFGVSLYMKNGPEGHNPHHEIAIHQQHNTNSQLQNYYFNPPSFTVNNQTGWHRDPTTNAMYFNRGDGWVYSRELGWQFDNGDGWFYDEKNGWYFDGGDDWFNKTASGSSDNDDWSALENSTFANNTSLFNISADNIFLDEENRTVYFNSNSSLPGETVFSNVSIISGLVNDTTENGWYYIEDDGYDSYNLTTDNTFLGNHTSTTYTAYNTSSVLPNSGSGDGSLQSSGYGSSGSGSGDGSLQSSGYGSGGSGYEIGVSTTPSNGLYCNDSLMHSNGSYLPYGAGRLTVKTTYKTINTTYKRKVIMKRKIKLYKKKKNNSSKYKKFKLVLIINKKVIIRTNKRKKSGLIKNPMSLSMAPVKPEAPLSPCILARIKERSHANTNEHKDPQEKWPSNHFKALAALAFFEFVVAILHVELCFRCLSSDNSKVEPRRQTIQNTTYIIANPETMLNRVESLEMNLTATKPGGLPDISYAAQEISYNPPSMK